MPPTFLPRTYKASASRSSPFDRGYFHFLKVFMNKLTSYILQDETNYYFVSIPGEDPGLYSTWSSFQSGKRIKARNISCGFNREEDGTIDEEVEGIFHEEETSQESRGLMTGILIRSVIIVFIYVRFFWSMVFR